MIIEMVSNDHNKTKNTDNDIFRNDKTKGDNDNDNQRSNNKNNKHQ